MSNNEYTFYKGLDSFGYDSKCVGNTSINELKKICSSNDEYIGFNTYGYIKFLICDIDDLKTVSGFTGPTDGIYIHNEKYRKQKLRLMKTHINFEDYDYYPYMDSPGNDALRIDPNTPLQEMKLIVDQTKNLGFNTLGFVKNKIDPNFIKLSDQYNQGLYVKKRKFRVKMICNWTTSENLCKEWNVMSKGNYTWNDIEITWSNDNIDFYIIVNKPGNEYYVPDRTIVLQMEPFCYDSNQNWGVKTWGEWSKPDESKFLQVRPHTKYLNTTFWQLQTTYTQFKNMFNIPKTKLMSSICSSKYFDPGHIKRIDFLKFIESKNDDIVKVDIYNHDNIHNFKGYKGKHTPNKDAGIMPYKYYFMPENNDESNFITEKIWEPLICECLCFYWGCSNIGDWFDTRAIIILDMDNFEKSFNIIKDAIINDEWSKRLPYIRREKQKVLDYYNFFPTLERIIKQDFKFDYKPTNDQIIYHKYFNNYIGTQLTKVCFLHSCCVNNNIVILENIINKINDSGLINVLDCVFIINIGNPIINTYGNKYVVINYSNDTKLFEKPTLNLMNVFSKFHDTCKLLYLHTKGISYNNLNTRVNDWTNYMLYELVDNYQLCLDILDIHDTVGCNYNEKPHKHYSGNFWWTNAKYMKTLKQITSNVRHDCEWYILTGGANHYVLHNSGINHYENNYPRPFYVKDKSHYYKFNDGISVKCVNLVRRPDRKEEMIKLLEREKIVGCEFIEAVDGQALVITDNIKHMFRGNDFGSRPGFIGCALSHFNIWNSLVSDVVYDKYLVIEDDIELSNNFVFKFNYVLELLKNIEWDIVYLGYSTKVEKQYNYTKIEIKNYDIMGNIGGTFCYLINKNGANKFLKFIGHNGIKHGIDYFMFIYHKQMDLKQFQVDVPLAFSECVRNNNRSDSDIQYNFNRLF